MEYLFPEKVRVINNPTDYPVDFKDAAGNIVAAAAAYEADINFFGQVKTPFLNSVVLTRGLQPTIEKWTIDAAQTAQIELDTPIANNTKVKVEVLLRDRSRQFRNVIPEYLFERPLVYTVVLQSTDTEANFLYKLFKAINLAAYRERDFQLKATDPNGTLNDAAKTLDVLGLEFKERGLYAFSFKVTGEDSFPSEDVLTFAPVQEQETTEGVNYGFDLEFLEKLDAHNNRPYYFDDKERFESTATYTMVHFETNINRPDPRPSTYSDRKRFVLYIKESSEMQTYIDNLADFFLTTPATRFTALRPDGLIVSFNSSAALTNTNAASSATNLDSDHAVLTAKFGTLAGTDPKLVEARSVVIDDTLTAFTLANFKTNA